MSERETARMTTMKTWPALGRTVLLMLTAVSCSGLETQSLPAPFTCVAGQFSRGQQASVTCHLGPEVHADVYHLEVVRYPYDAPASHSGDEVLNCNRLDGKFHCITRRGFEFNGEVEENVTILIPRVTEREEGRYACQLIPPGGRKKRTCDLRVRDLTSEQRSPSTPGGYTAAVLHSCPQTGHTLAAVLAMLLIPSVILNICFLRKNRRRPKRSSQATSSNRRGLMYKDKTSDDSDDDSDTKVRGITCVIPRILPYSKLEEEEKREQSGQQPSRWHERFPYRQPYTYPRQTPDAE